MLDRITYTRPAYVRPISRVERINPSQVAAGNSYSSLASADSRPAQNQAPASSVADSPKNNVIPFPLNQAAYLGTRKPELSTSVSAATAAYGKTVEENTAHEKLLKRLGKIECQTCNERTYQDVSNDPGVSFKAPAHVAPENAGAAVAAHEQEHVRNEQANAAREEKQIISQSVKIFTSVCPECGKVYVSGGETRTVTATKSTPTQDGPKKGELLDKYA